MKNMSFKDKVNKSKEQFKEGMSVPVEKNNVIAQVKTESKPKISDQEKFYKKANFAAKGIAFWFLIPVFLVIGIIGVFVLFWIWDMIVGLFS